MAQLASNSPLHLLLRNKGKLLKVSKGQSLGSSDDKQDVMLLEKGFIKRYLISNTGSLGVQIVYGPGDVFPLTLVFRSLLNQSIYDGPEVYHYRTMVDSYVYALSPTTLKNVATEQPMIYKNLLSEAGQHLAVSIQELENIALRSSYRRVAHILFYYAKSFGQRSSRGREIVLPLTHQDIADILNVSRETVSVCMVTLRSKNIIKTGRHVVVPSLKKLSDEAYG